MKGADLVGMVSPRERSSPDGRGSPVAGALGQLWCRGSRGENGQPWWRGVALMGSSVAGAPGQLWWSGSPGEKGQPWWRGVALVEETTLVERGSTRVASHLQDCPTTLGLHCPPGLLAALLQVCFTKQPASTCKSVDTIRPSRGPRQEVASSNGRPRAR